MATQKLIKVGTSVAAVLPKALLEQYGITAGSAITVEVVDGGFFVRPADKAQNANSDDARVADTALNLIRRYQKALTQLADA